MAKSKVYKKGGGAVGFNMTPMIDCTFQLILFFMLATRMASADYVQMKIPKPDQSISKQYEEAKAVVNVVPYGDKEITATPSRDGQAAFYQIGTLRLTREEIGKLSDLIRQTKAAIPDPEKRKAWVVELRADSNVEYAAVEPILIQLQTAEQDKLRITAMPKMANE